MKPLAISMYQPYPAPMLETWFLSNFVSSFARSSVVSDAQHSWMHYLYAFSENGNDSMRYSIRAATMIFSAELTHDINVQQAAQNWYIAALERQRLRISLYLEDVGSNPSVPSEEEICTSMMLLYFELIKPSVTASWLKHLSGVTRLLQQRGPENCQSGVTHLIFRSLRLLAVGDFPDKIAIIF